MIVIKVKLFNIFNIIDLFVSAYSSYFQKKDTNTQLCGTKPSIISSFQLFLSLLQASHFKPLTVSQVTRYNVFPTLQKQINCLHFCVSQKKVFRFNSQLTNFQYIFVHDLFWPVVHNITERIVCDCRPLAILECCVTIFVCTTRKTRVRNPLIRIA